MPLPRKNVAYTFEVSLVAQSNRPQFQANPTLAAGDVKVDIDGAGFNNLTTLPTVEPAGGRVVKVALTAAEMNGDRICVQFVDQAGNEWDEMLAIMYTSSVVFEQLDPQGTALTEAYAADGAPGTLAQLLYMIWSALGEFSISGTTITAKKLDGSTTSMTFTLDDATNPTSRTRAT